MHRSSLRPPAVVALLVALIALVAAGCGGGGGGGNESADPAKIAPKNTLVWVTGQVRPEGGRKTAVESIAKKVLGVSDPGARIAQLLDKSIRDSGTKASFKDDIEPWLGRRAGVAVTTLGAGGSSQAALIVAAKDTGKAKQALPKLAAENGRKATERDYQGTKYWVSPNDNSVAGVVKDYVVLGTLPAFKAVVDASKGANLTQNSQYKPAGNDKLGSAWIDTKAIVGALGASGQIPGGGAALQGLIGAANQPITMTLAAAARQLTVEAISGVTRQAQSGKPNSLVPDLPGDAWLAVGLPNLGQTIRQTLDQIGSGVGAGLIETAQQQIRAATGLDLNRDILASLGEVAVFGQGSSILTVGGGVMIQTPDPAAARRLLSKIGPLIARQSRGSVRVGRASVAGATGLRFSTARIPGAINAVLRGNRMVIAYTDASTRAALAPRQTLSNAPSFQQASQSLGGAQPALYLAFAPLANLVSATGGANGARARQYLSAFTTLAAGSRVQGNQQVGRFVLSLK
ncbi:MAG: hypothetical protein QOE65_305 [Solirubrobacteraceae bacterium]|nr:hypothetical protein [Solirubrobacteraceae bacterium]